MQNQIPNNWQKIKLGGIVDNFDFKRVPLSSMQREKRKGSIPYYGASGIIDYIDDYLFDGEYLLISEDGENLKSRNLPIAFLSSGKFWINNHAHIVKAKNDFDNKLIYYWFSKNSIAPYITGSAQPKLNQENLNSIELLWPNEKEREKIVKILSSLDNKIEVNNKISKTLEEMAQAIFKEWFVLPSPALAKEGKLSDIAIITMGQSPASNFYNQKNEGLPFHQGVTNFGNRFSKHEIYCTQNNRIAEKGDILFSVRAPVGRLNIADTKISMGRGVASIRQKNNYQSYLYYLLKRLFKKEDSLGGGSVFPSVTRNDMESMRMLIPIEETVKKFESITSVIDRRIELVEKENQKLAALRDLLLPKLMRGEIRI